MQIWLQASSAGFGIEAQFVRRSASDPLVDIGPKVEDLSGIPVRHFELDGDKWRVVNLDAAFLHRRDQEVIVAFALEYGSEQLDERGPADRRLEIVPGAVGCDAHIQIA